MRYADVINDIKKLVGMKLSSIKPGAEIRLISIDQAEERITLKTSDNKSKTRPLSEIKHLWDLLQKNPAVHVDKALGGSGSSRNQPETILANLPYIEYVYIDAKKHISFVGEKTHAFGTIKEMSPLLAQEIKIKLTKHTKPQSKDSISAIVVANDMGKVARFLEEISGISPTPVSPGLYEFKNDNRNFILVSKSTISNNIEVGTYLLVCSQEQPESKLEVVVGGISYRVSVESGVKLMIYDK